MGNSVLEKLTEGVQFVDKRKEGAALIAKWEATGLLEGIDSDRQKGNMALMLENQAKYLLKEASQMSAGDVEGFASVAFPLVRRVFAGLVANDIVSVQPMNLPSGLIFFLDFQHVSARLGAAAGDSVYGGGVVGFQQTGGVSLVGANVEKSFYNNNNGYSSPTGSLNVTVIPRASGTVGAAAGTLSTWAGEAAYVALADQLVRFDPDIASGTAVSVGTVAISAFTNHDPRDLVAISITASTSRYARRLAAVDPLDSTRYMFVLVATGSETALQLGTAQSGSRAATYPILDAKTTGNGLGSVVGTTPWGLENDVNIPEIDIKVDSVTIETETKKLKAKWTPELQQDLNAYQNVDAEVELTSLLSEHIALEIDQMILEDLVKYATAGTQYWSRRPGKFVNASTGQPITSVANELVFGADFTGNVSEWYETLMERINDVSAQIHRKLLKGGANFLLVGPEVANILEMTAGFRASVTHDDDRGEAGTVKLGSINKKWDIYVSPYFLRNVILVGRKGASFLESGYVYAPYVPLQVTPTLYDPESFVPRKGVMTRFGRKMVRPDHFGLVVVVDMLG